MNRNLGGISLAPVPRFVEEEHVESVCGLMWRCGSAMTNIGATLLQVEAELQAERARAEEEERVAREAIDAKKAELESLEASRLAAAEAAQRSAAEEEARLAEERLAELLRKAEADNAT